MKNYILVIVFLSACLVNNAQSIKPFKSLRYDEDYAYLKNDSAPNGYTHTKYHPVFGNKGYISMGGDVRFQYFYFKNQDWGEAPEDKDGFILTRWLAHADLHYGKHFRSFVQLQSSLANGMEQTPSPVDENQLDFHQGFVDAIVPVAKEKTITARVGRQELLYGSQRLVAVRDGPNNRQSFDAAKIFYKAPSLKIDAFFSHYVRSKAKIFDDGFNKDSRFWGAYVVKNKVPLFSNVDLYYLGLWKRKATFDEGSGKELRHSIGSRIWGAKKDFRFDIEGLYQFGSFNKEQIDAWTFSVNAGYQLAHTLLKPEAGLKAEWISGDKQPGDQKLQTFNPLYPRGGYFGLAALIGPSNLFDIHPSLDFELSKQLSLNTDCDIFWRYINHDGIYGPNVALIYSGKNNPYKYIGKQLSADLVFTPNNFLYFRSEFTWFNSGKFLQAAGPGKDILFAALTAQVKF